MMVRDPYDKGLQKFSKCPTTDTYDDPSCTTVMMVRDPYNKGLQKFSKCPTMDTYDGPSCFTVMMVSDPSFRVPYIYLYQV